MSGKDPIRELTMFCGAMKEISGSIYGANPNGVNHVADVLEAAAGLLTQLIKTKTAADPNDKIYEQTQQFDILLKEKERSFIEKMDKKIEDMAGKLEELQNVLENKEELLQKSLLDIQALSQKALDKLDLKNQEKLEELNQKFEEQKEEYTNKEKKAFSDFEVFLVEHLQELSKEWNNKLSTADEKINLYQKDLQEIIHDKHLQGQKKNDLILAEDRRMAAEHEQISREFQERKAAATAKIRQLTNQVKTMTESLNDQNATTKTRLKELEKTMLDNREIINEERRTKLDRQNDNIKELSEVLEKKRLEIDAENSKSSIQIRDIEKEYENKCKEEELKTEKEIFDAMEKINKEYNPQIDTLNRMIDEAEVQRGISLERLRKSALTSAEQSENELQELNKRHEEERKRYKAQLNKQKEIYHNVQAEKDADIEELKHKMQQTLGAAMTGYDTLEKQHAEEISNIMRQFEDQQKKLTDLHRLSLENRDRRRADELSRLKAEHEQRKQEILFRIEQQMKMEAEKAVNETVEKANESHTKEVTSIKTMILDIKGRMELLQMKIDGLYKLHNQKLEQMMQDQDESLREDLKKLQEKGESEKAEIKDLKQRLMNETQEVDRRKDIIMKEANELDQNIHEMHEKFEKKMSMMESQFNASKKNISKSQNELSTRQHQLTVQMVDQTAKIVQLGEIAEKKESEANEFEASFDKKKEEFATETRSKAQQELDECMMKPREFESEMEELRETLQAQMKSLEEQLAIAKQNTEKTTQLMMIERAQALEEAETELKLQYEERVNDIKENHEKRLELMLSELHDARILHEMKMQDLRSNFDEQMSGNENQFQDLLKELNEEKEELEKQTQALNDQINELEHRECPYCIQKKQNIRELLVKKDEYSQRLANMRKQVLLTDEKMNVIFPQRKKRAANSSLLFTVSQHPRIITPHSTFSARQSMP